MTDPCRYLLETLWEDAEFVLSRAVREGVADGSAHGIRKDQTGPCGVRTVPRVTGLAMGSAGGEASARGARTAARVRQRFLALV